MELVRTAPEVYGPIWRWARQQNLLGPDDTSVIFFDFDVLDNRLDYLANQFPAHSLHAVAIKSNPLYEVLRHIGQRGFGLEAASIEETILAQRAGLPAERIVFDSPVKTAREIQWCEQQLPGLHLNVNTLSELDRLSPKTDLRVGMRINPQVDPGSPAVYNVSTDISKFGIPISRWADIVAAAVRYPFVQGLHLHIGSEMSRLDVHAQAVGRILELAEAIRQARSAAGIDRPISFIDIGGGFPARYTRGDQPDLKEYLHFLRQHAPTLFTDYRIITEFGRFVQAHTAWFLSDVEYVLRGNAQQPDVPIIHGGADLFLREVYQQGSPQHEMTVLDAAGRPKEQPLQMAHVAGPLCFAGDYLARNKRLPRMEAGDKIAIADVGANSFSMWSRHCSRVFPKVIGYSQRLGNIHILKERESMASVLNFWGAPTD